MSNQNQNTNQTVENLLFNYLLNSLELNTSSPISNPDNLTNTTLSERNINMLLRIFHSYQRNVEMYYRTMRELIDLLRTNANAPGSSRSIPMRQPRQYNDLSNNIIPQEPIRTPTYPSATASSLHTPPNTSLNARDIENNISTITYSSIESETRCPISFEDFQIGESICKINYCGHIFKRDALYEWLENHNTCPVCRRNVIQSSRNSSRNANENTSSLSTSYTNYIARNLLASLNTNPGNIQTYSYTIDIPLFYDMSGFQYDMSRNARTSNISANYDYIFEDEEN